MPSRCWRCCLIDGDKTWSPQGFPLPLPIRSGDMLQPCAGVSWWQR